MIFIRDGFGNALSLRPNTLTENVIAPRNYLDEAEGQYSNIIWIPSQKVESNTLEVFVVHTPAHEDRHIKPLCDFTNKVKQDNADLGQIKLDCLNQFYHLELNEIPVLTQTFYTRNNKTGQDGLKYFIPIDTLDRGKHTLKLYYNFYNKEKDTIYRRIQAKTEFYKSSNKTTQIVGE